MRVHGLEIPGNVIAAAQAAMTSPFRLHDVRTAADRAAADEGMDFGIQHRSSVLDRLADRLIQGARRKNQVEFLGNGQWRPSAAKASDDA